MQNKKVWVILGGLLVVAALYFTTGKDSLWKGSFGPLPFGAPSDQPCEGTDVACWQDAYLNAINEVEVKFQRVEVLEQEVLQAQADASAKSKVVKKAQDDVRVAQAEVDKIQRKLDAARLRLTPLLRIPLPRPRIPRRGSNPQPPQLTQAQKEIQLLEQQLVAARANLDAVNAQLTAAQIEQAAAQNHLAETQQELAHVREDFANTQEQLEEIKIGRIQAIRLTMRGQCQAYAEWQRQGELTNNVNVQFNGDFTSVQQCSDAFPNFWSWPSASDCRRYADYYRERNLSGNMSNNFIGYGSSTDPHFTNCLDAYPNLLNWPSYATCQSYRRFELEGTLSENSYDPNVYNTCQEAYSELMQQAIGDRCARYVGWKLDGTLSENIANGFGTYEEVNLCLQTFPRLWSWPARETCRVYRQWDLEGTLTANGFNNDVMNDCNAGYPQIMYRPDIARCQQFAGWEREGTLTDNITNGSAYGMNEWTACLEAYPHVRDLPVESTCRAYRQWEIEGTLSANPDYNPDVLVACREVYPEIMQESPPQDTEPTQSETEESLPPPPSGGTGTSSPSGGIGPPPSGGTGTSSPSGGIGPPPSGGTGTPPSGGFSFGPPQSGVSPVSPTSGQRIPAPRMILVSSLSHVLNNGIEDLIGVEFVNEWSFPVTMSFVAFDYTEAGGDIEVGQFRLLQKDASGGSEDVTSSVAMRNNQGVDLTTVDDIDLSSGGNDRVLINWADPTVATMQPGESRTYIMQAVVSGAGAGDRIVTSFTENNAPVSWYLEY